MGERFEGKIWGRDLEERFGEEIWVMDLGERSRGKILQRNLRERFGGTDLGRSLHQPKPKKHPNRETQTKTKNGQPRYTTIKKFRGRILLLCFQRWGLKNDVGYLGE